MKLDKKAVKNLKNNGILILGGFIFGQPDDTKEDLVENTEFAKNLNIDLLFSQILTPYPYTEIREELNKLGLVTNEDDYSSYNGLLANIKTKHMSQRTSLYVYEILIKFLFFISSFENCLIIEI